MERVVRWCWKNLDDESSSKKKFIGGALIGGLVSYKVFQGVRGWARRRQNKSKIAAKREEGKLSKEKLEEFLIKKEIAIEMVHTITNLSFSDLQDQLQSGKLKAVDVLNAYQYKALQIDKKTNCITEVIWEAEEIALSLDLQTGKKGPLHGIPISLKESHYVKGYDCTAGFVEYVGKPVKEDNVLVQVLKKAGAVPFVRTNIPQGMMTCECSNPIYGSTGNPHNPTRIPGGSSGGEGALIASGGSLLGLGSDIGGSIRIPAHMSGCCGLKPTTDRLSIKGEMDFNSGQPLIRLVLGPLAANVDGLVSCMRNLLVPQMYELDPDIVPVPFRNEIFEEKKKLTIGYFIDDGNLKPVPACQRAVLEVKAILKAQGHTLVPFKPVDVYRMIELFHKSCFADGGQNFLDIMKYDKVDPTLWKSFVMLKLPERLRRILSSLAAFILKDRMLGIMGKSLIGIKTIPDYWDHASKLQAYRVEFLKKWKDNKLDALISPGFAYPAIPHGCFQDSTAAVSYTSIYNLLNYPAGILDVTRVTQQDVDNLKDYPTKSGTEKFVKEISKDTVGLPVGVQFAALPFQEERVLRLMKDVESDLRPKQS